MGNIASGPFNEIYLSWGNTILCRRNAQDLESRFPRLTKQGFFPRITRQTGQTFIDLSPNNDGVASWAMQTNKQERTSNFGGGVTFREAVEILLRDEPNRCSNGLERNLDAGGGNIDAFLRLFRALIELSEVAGCLRSGCSPVQDDLEFSYRRNRKYLKAGIDNIQQAENFLALGGELKCEQIIIDFAPFFFDHWNSRFPRVESFDEIVTRRFHESKPLHDIPSELWGRLRQMYEENERGKKTQEIHRQDSVGFGRLAPEPKTSHLSPRFLPNSISPDAGGQDFGQWRYQEFAMRAGNHSLQMMSMFEGGFRSDMPGWDFGWKNSNGPGPGMLRDSIDSTDRFTRQEKRGQFYTPYLLGDTRN